MTLDLTDSAGREEIAADHTPLPAGSTGADVVVRQLEAMGVEYVFGLCGHSNIALLDALGKSSIDFVVFRHEQTAAHAADGYARASGKPGVVLVHVGPGMTNAITGVLTAALDSVPLVVIGGDIPSYYRGRHPHQEINLHADADQVAVYRPFVKRAWDVSRVEDLPRFLERAFWTAQNGRPGATLLNVPMDMFSRPLDLEAADRYPLPVAAPAPDLSPEAADQVAAELEAAERPLLYVGGGLREPGSRSALLRIAERLDIPIVHSLMAKGTVPDEHPLALGMPGFWGLELTNSYSRQADVVLALATRFAETDASSWEPEHTWRMPPTRLLHVDIDPAEIGRNYPVALGMVADVGKAVLAIDAALERRGTAPVRRPALREEIAAARRGVFAETRERGASDAFPLRPERILRDLLESLPSDAVLVTDVGWNKNGVAQRYELPAEGRFITPGGASTMGFGPAGALGVQVAWPDRTVVALIGDGGMSAQLAALPTAVERGLPVLFVVMNNAAHGTIADLQAGSYGRSYGCEFLDRDGNPYSPDFAALGRACGLDGYDVPDAASLRDVLQQAVGRRRPAVIDVPMVNEPVPTPGHWNIKDIYKGAFD
ncbi:thiamine pyrophosphate-binding protein [Aquipuribacter nitratireducens]|uniref:Thiamine pyrophosphate-binding protein n=1 Tax=Aquipuribacter nitratireducens TaxID=650104 RepID=A0ABW0GTF7_9MICO